MATQAMWKPDPHIFHKLLSQFALSQRGLWIGYRLRVQKKDVKL